MHRDEKRSEVEKFVSSYAGRRLPGERDLAEKIGISRPRLRAILGQLEAEGHVQRRHGSGTYAAETAGHGLTSVMLLLDATLKLGDDPFISRCVDQIQTVLQNAGIQCFIQRTGNGGPLPRTGGIIALGTAAHAALESPPLAGLPATALFGDSSLAPGKRCSLLQLENEAAGALAARKLVQGGAKRILFFGRPSRAAARERLTGVKRELGGAGIPLEVVSSAMNYNAGLEQGHGLRVAAGDHLGIIAANDWLAVGIQAGLQAAARTAKTLPALVSFDGLPVALRLEPPIASLAIPIDTLCDDALTELQRLQNPKAAGRTIRYALEWASADTSN